MSLSLWNSLQLLKRYPAFARVFWADVLAQTGQNMLVVAFPTLILEVTRDLSLTGLAFTGEILAFGLLSPWAGWIADRWEQKALMIGANLARLGLLVLLLWTLSQGYPAWYYLLLSVALGATAALFSPARAAFLRRLLQGDDLLEAVALEGTCGFLIRLVAPALMGVVLVVSDARVGVALDACTYLISSLLIAPAWVSGPRCAPQFVEKSLEDVEKSSALSSPGEGHGATCPTLPPPDSGWKAGWRLLSRSSSLRGLLMADLLISFLGMASWSTAVAYLEQVLHVRAANNGWLQASMGLTGALGTRWVGRFSDTPRLRWGLLGLITLSYLGLGYADSLPRLILVWSLRGLGVGALVVLISQQMAREVPASLMGRTQAAWEQSALLACFLGSVITPWLLRNAGPLLAFRLYGWTFLGFLMVGLYASRKDLREAPVRGQKPSPG